MTESVISAHPSPGSVVSPQITERTFYPNLIKVIRGKGGSGVSEVKFNSEPDIIFELSDRKWLLGVKIGETPTILKSAFVQYNRHKDESGIKHGLLLFLPESFRKIRPNEETIDRALETRIVDCLVDTPQVKEEYGDSAFPVVIDRLMTEVVPKILRKEEKAYSINLIVKFLTEQIEELMSKIPANDPEILKAIIDQNLLSGIGNLDRKHAKVATQFLGASILLSQLMFLRLYGVAHKNILPSKPVTRSSVRASFTRIAGINYRPIYRFDVIDSVSEEYLRETYDLISGLEIEQSRFELPGRIFHAVMPKNIRKLMAAFYTRPQSADILTQLSIDKWSETVFDPACGSGTILVSAYRRKAELHEEAGIEGNPHKEFCERQIFGADIMPFAQHLTTANLAAMDPATTIKKTQIIRGDSLELALGPTSQRTGYQQRLFRPVAKGKDMEGEDYEVNLDRMDAVLMNPPFTKVERGISKFVDMARFNAEVGGDASLWTHFILLANEFLKEGGTFGAVLPISLLRGQETAKIRNLLFAMMTPLYIVKATLNYGFSESSEYRDVLFIARKGAAPKNHFVKFCLLKYDIGKTTWDMARHISEVLHRQNHLRRDDLDVESFPFSDLLNKMNLMPYVGVCDYRHRDSLLSLTEKSSANLNQIPDGYVKEGVRTEGKAADVLFVTRDLHPSRLEEAFLGFKRETSNFVEAISKKGVTYKIEKVSLAKSLRTAVGQSRMNIEDRADYIAQGRYEEFPQVLRATGVKIPKGTTWSGYFSGIRSSVRNLETNLVISRRLNPFSPNVHFVSFYSKVPFSPGDQFKVIKEEDPNKAKAVCVMLNSAVFLAHLFLFKEETTGRYIDIRGYDLHQLRILPSEATVDDLVKVFNRYSTKDFPPLREQMDTNFTIHYEKYQKTKDWSKVNFNLQPSQLRLGLDQDVFQVLGANVGTNELLDVYQAIEKEMIITRGLTRQ